MFMRRMFMKKVMLGVSLYPEQETLEELMPI